MKIFAVIAFCLCLAMSSTEANDLIQVSNTNIQQTVNPEEFVRDFLDYMVKNYNLTPAQQSEVKYAGSFLIDKARGKDFITESVKTTWINEFNAAILVQLSSSQKKHYQKKNKTTTPMIEAIINAAVSK